MGMTIEKAIKQLETYSIPCGRYKAAYDFSIEIMRKYQQIEQIIHNTDFIEEDVIRYKMICEVIEDGKID